MMARQTTNRTKPTKGGVQFVHPVKFVVPWEAA